MALTEKEMEAILLEHEIAELEQDIDATMATLVPEPQYELASLGWAIRGREAVRETYNRILSYASTRDVAAEKRVHAIAENTLLRESHVSFNTKDGKRVTGNYLVVMCFDPELKLITGERMYMDPLFAQMMTEELGDDFGDVPGVSLMSETAPIIDRHDAFAVAESRGRTINQPAPTKAG